MIFVGDPITGEMEPVGEVTAVSIVRTPTNDERIALQTCSQIVNDPKRGKAMRRAAQERIDKILDKLIISHTPGK